MAGLRDVLLTMSDLMKVQRRVPKEVIDKSVQAGYDIPAFHGTGYLDSVLGTNKEHGGTLLPGTEHYGVHVGPLNTALDRLFLPRLSEDPGRRLALQEAFDKLQPYRTHPESNSAIMPLMISAENIRRVPDVGGWDDPFGWREALRERKKFELPSQFRDIIHEHAKVGEKIYDKSRHDDRDQVFEAIDTLKKEFADIMNRELQKEGIDGLLYRNMYEGPGTKDSLMVVNPGNIRSWDAEFNPEHKGKMGLRRKRGGLVAL